MGISTINAVAHLLVAGPLISSDKALCLSNSYNRKPGQEVLRGFGAGFGVNAPQSTSLQFILPCVVFVPFRCCHFCRRRGRFVISDQCHQYYCHCYCCWHRRCDNYCLLLLSPLLYCSLQLTCSSQLRFDSLVMGLLCVARCILFTQMDMRCADKTSA